MMIKIMMTVTTKKTTITKKTATKTFRSTQTTPKAKKKF